MWGIVGRANCANSRLGIARCAPTAAAKTALAEPRLAATNEACERLAWSLGALVAAPVRAIEREVVVVTVVVGAAAAAAAAFAAVDDVDVVGAVATNAASNVGVYLLDYYYYYHYYNY